eukprot:CAMPEP_0202896140 /NCGR_PEP_ID=MMETSP1392-20130828/5191_1 /ASSEMBLY_ACC=CAM_ASM_000868 /TAXON_ID=225041 /ORGANISM="Chlamydomonas chlamydogama, Strain SAG 11-48b" /LENGTH=64 /DNA_ID=CAMNT_0049581381 /DNA_START=11 /DNA_END=202 /DNA_ORIENTATION=+
MGPEKSVPDLSLPELLRKLPPDYVEDYVLAYLGRSERRALGATSKECREWILSFPKTITITSGI